MNRKATRQPLDAARILLVEDDPGDVLITRESLADAPVACDLAVVDDGAMALDYLHKRGEFSEAQTPHLVLLDLNLPKVSGHEVLAELKADPARDSRLMAEYAPLWTNYERRTAQLAKQGVVDENLEQFRWLLEELRVSLFAQELKTPTPVSTKRLQKTWEGLSRG